jgi:hypothetical protein
MLSWAIPNDGTQGRSVLLKQSRHAIIALCLFLAVQVSVAQDRNFGLGVILGEPSGISAKLWTSQVNALDFGLGWSVGGDRIGKYDGSYDGGSRLHFHMDYVWHSFDVIHSAERVHLYYGVGGRFNSGAGYSSSVAARGVLGVTWFPSETPIDMFLELVPSFQLMVPTGFGMDAGIGARYFF